MIWFLGRVLNLREGLVVFESSFVEQDGHGVLDGNSINVFEGISNG